MTRRWDDGKPFWDTPSVVWDEKVEIPMSTANSERRDYNFADSILYSESGLMIAACTTYPAVAARLKTDYLTQTTTLLQNARTATNGSGNNAAEKSGLTIAQNAALDEVISLSGLARTSASKSPQLRANTTLLREQFCVGDKRNDLPGITDRALKIHAGCVDADNVAALEEQGWKAADSTALQAAILALTGADTIQEARKGVNKGGTASLIQINNELYQRTLAIQNASKIEYRLDAPANIAPREAFRWNQFPPAENRDLPNIPHKLTVKPLAAGSLQIYINYNIAERATDYVITSKNKATGQVIRTDITTDNKLTITYTGIAPGTEIEITMTARNETGESKPTRPVTAKVP